MTVYRSLNQTLIKCSSSFIKYYFQYSTMDGWYISIIHLCYFHSMCRFKGWVNVQDRWRQGCRFFQSFFSQVLTSWFVGGWKCRSQAWKQYRRLPAHSCKHRKKQFKNKLNADGACVYYGLLFELNLESSLVQKILFLTCDKLVFASVNHFKIEQLVACFA